MTPRSFDADHEGSKDKTVRRRLIEAYRRRWPGCAITYQDARHLQRAGVDVIVARADGRRIKIDEKIRARDYGDLCCELTVGADPGWAVDSSKITDLIAYVILPANVVWLLPYRDLRTVVQTRADGAWQTRPRQIVESTRNGRVWRTTNVSVPWTEICDALGRTKRQLMIELPFLPVTTSLMDTDINWGW